MTKRLITENWYKFLNETDYRDDPVEGAMASEALAELKILRDQKARIEERIKELEMQMASSEYSVSQIKEDKDG
jgi:hypothetical protein